MPITAKFSQSFYDKFGHEAVDELVDFLNRIDSASRSELREINALNFTRFDDRLERRMVELDAKIHARFAKIDARFAKVDERFAAMDAKIDARFGELDRRIDSRFGELDGKIDRVADQIRAEMAFHLRDQMKWMFIFWAGTVIPLGSLIIALHNGWL